MKRLWPGFASPLADGIVQFLEYKRALGRRFLVEEATLRLLDRFLVEQGIPTIETITPDVIDAFLASRPRARPRSYNHLLGTVARCFTWLVAQGRLSTSPVRARPRRVTSQRLPFLMDQAAARRLLEVASQLPDNPRAPLRGPTYRTIFALLYALGLRVGEVARLTVGDVDWDRRLLLIRETKFGKSRLVPFGPRVRHTLEDYLKLRRARNGNLSATSPLFTFTRRGPIHPCTISQTFHRLIPQLKLVVPEGVAPPRLHDLRHAFAVATLLRWYERGLDPGNRLLHLSTFLGHVDPASTAVYLTITPALFQAASERFARFAAPAPPEIQT
ncbi:MAG: tyrosine-type recombinase/integrase [Planctomycetota bacterium]|jgi:site-specific recombinase XerD